MSHEASGNPYPEGSGEHLLYAIFGELPGPDACECGMPTECPPAVGSVGGYPNQEGDRG